MATVADPIRIYPPFDRLSEPELQIARQTLEVVYFPKGALILKHNGLPSQYLYLIQKGAVRLEREGQVVQVLEEADFFGFTSLLGAGPSLLDVLAEEDVQAYRLPQATFHQLLQNPAFADFFHRRSERLYRTSGSQTAPWGGELTSPAGDLIRRPPIYVSPEASIAEAAQIMRKAWASSVLVSGEMAGILTDRDLRWILADGLPPETPVRRVMSHPLKTLPIETPVYGASLFMLEENIHHVPLIQNDQIVGVITDTDLLRHQAKSPLYLLKRVEEGAEDEILARYGLEITGTVEKLFRGGLDVVQIGRVIASLNDTLTKRLLKQAEAELGPPPTPYAWIVFGSEGRLEQALLTDQDNALIYAEETPTTQTYFAALAERVVNGRIRAGFPPCTGGYLATKWRHTLNEWVHFFRGWINTPEAQAVLEAAIFFDFRPVYGQLSLEPLEQLLQEAGKQQIFLAHMARTALNFPPPLGLFGRIRTEEGKLDLKKAGVSPIVTLARLYALEVSATARPTLARLEAAAQAGALSQDGAETLAETYHFILRLRLKEQLRAYRAGLPLTNQVALEALSALEKRQLKKAFQTIRDIQRFTAERFQTGRLG